MMNTGGIPSQSALTLESNLEGREDPGLKGEAELSRRETIAHLRHELRTPLNAIIGYTEMLLEDIEETARQETARDLKKIRKGGLELLSLINDALNPAKIDAGHEPFDLSCIGPKLYRDLRTPLSAVMECVEGLLEKANESVDAEFLPDLRRIHDAAFRLLSYIDNSANPAGLHGEKLAEATGRGDTWRLAKEAMECIQPREIEIPEGKKVEGLILVADDNEMNRDLLSRRLERQGHSVLLAENGLRALEIIRDRRPDMVLLDVMMPEMNGFQVLQYLKGNHFWRDIPVIMISALDEMESVIRCIEMGAEDYLPKPVDPVLLRARIGACLEKKQLRDREIEHQKRLKEVNAKLEVRNRFIRQTFGRYLSDEIVENILESPQGLNLGGEKRTITIMMADLRGFTSIVERLPPEDVVSLINHYLECMTEVIIAYQGTIDELIGDAVLVLFGAPVQRKDDACRAIACAVEMQAAMAEINRWNRQSGYPEIAVGIGINTGEVVVGNIGSKKRAKYGVVGRNVNLTSRIESYTVGGQIFVSENTMRDCGPILRVDDEALVMPKGVRDPITVYEIGGIGGEFNRYLPQKKEVELSLLDRPLPIRFTILAGKYSGTKTYAASIVKIKDGTAEIQAALNPDRLADLKISLLDGEEKEISAELYAKVIKVLTASPPMFRVAFTSVPPEAEAFLKFSG